MNFPTRIPCPAVTAWMPLLILCAASLSTAFEEEGSTAASQAATADAVAVLASDASREQKVNACRRLAALGGPDAIAPLAALLTDEELAHPARLALEAIPDPTAGEALRTALPGLEGKLLVGAIHSLAARREARAVADLGHYLTHRDPQVVAAACTALGIIASDEAITLLQNAGTNLSEEVRPQWGNACLRAVAALREQDRDAEAAQLCQLLRQAPLPQHVRDAATRHAILIRPDAAALLLQELLTSPDDNSFAMALTVSREIDSPEVTRILLASLPTLPTSRQAQIVRALEDRGDPTAQDALLQSSQSSDAELRAAALLALGRSGGASALPTLLEAATDPNAEIVAAAQQAMIALPGDDVNVAMVAALADTDDALRRFLIDVIGRRGIASAGAELLPLVNDPDEATRVAALRALGQIIEASQLPVLTARLLSATSDEERQAVQDSLRAACRRTADKEGCARQIQPSLNQSDLATKAFLIDLLGTVGGPPALEIVAPLARHNEDAIQDAATRVLGQWRTPDVAPVLIELAQSAPQQKYRIRALRGYLRVIRQMDVADADKLVMVRQALQAATRPEERRLAVETLGRIPTAQALEETIHYLSEAELRAASCAAAVAIAEKIVNDQPAAVASPMREVLAVTDDPDITRRAEAVLAQGQLRD